MLKFSKANTKTKALYDAGVVPGGTKVYSLDLPSGYTCPGAKDCLSKCVNGKIQDGPDCKFRCFSASQEVTYPAVHAARVHNLHTIQGCGNSRKAIRERILKDIPRDAGVIRYHVAGDFYKMIYLLAAYDVARIRDDILFYGYTKSLHLLEKADLMEDPSIGRVLHNFRLTASRGGKYDHLIDKMAIREAVVVFSEDDAWPLDIDHDDSHAAKEGGDFALLLHGVQPAKSEASKALYLIRKAKA